MTDKGKPSLLQTIIASVLLFYVWRFFFRFFFDVFFGIFTGLVTCFAAIIEWIAVKVFRLRSCEERRLYQLNNVYESRRPSKIDDLNIDHGDASGILLLHELADEPARAKLLRLPMQTIKVLAWKVYDQLRADAIVDSDGLHVTDSERAEIELEISEAILALYSKIGPAKRGKPAPWAMSISVCAITLGTLVMILIPWATTVSSNESTALHDATSLQQAKDEPNVSEGKDTSSESAPAEETDSDMSSAPLHTDESTESTSLTDQLSEEEPHVTASGASEAASEHEAPSPINEQASEVKTDTSSGVTEFPEEDTTGTKGTPPRQSQFKINDWEPMLNEQGVPSQYKSTATTEVISVDEFAQRMRDSQKSEESSGF